MSKDTSGPWGEPVRMPVDGILDLHTFHPSDLPDLLNDYLEACRKKGLSQIRVIHGKGTGYLRRGVHNLLKKHPDVLTYQIAPPDAGGWGATIVTLSPLE